MSFKRKKKKASKHWLITVPGNDKSTILLYISPQCLPAEIFTREALAGLWMNDIGGWCARRYLRCCFLGGKINNAAENNRKKSEVWEKWPGDVHINYSGGGGEGSNMQLLEGWKHFSLNCAEQMCLHIYIWLKKKTQSLQTTSILVVQMLRVVINSYSSGFSSLSFCSASLDQVQASLSEGMSQNRLCSGSLSSFWLLILLLLLAFV